MAPGYQTYQDEMIRLRHGFPMWYGDPYKGPEIQIGDLGYMAEGAFRCIRRRSEPYDTSRAEEQLMDFRTPLLSCSLEERGFRAAGGAEIPVLPANVEGQVSLTTSRRALAVLSVEQGDADFISCSEGEKHSLGQEFLQNAHSWLLEAVAAGIVPPHFPLGRLMIVTGFYKTWNWAAMAMSSEFSTGGLGFLVKATGLGSGGLSYDWNDVQQVTPARSSGHHHPSGPVPPETVITPSTTELFAKCCRAHHDVRNQCIFLRGFRYRERVILRDELEVLAQLVDWKPSLFQKVIYRRTSKPTGTPASGPLTALPNASSDESSPQQQSFYAHIEPFDGFPGPDACDALYDAVALEKFMEEDLITVIVHDDELINLFERSQSAEEHQPKPVGQRQTSIQTTELLVKKDSPSHQAQNLMKREVTKKLANPFRLFALIIGINEYKPGRQLRQAVTDARAIESCLKNTFNVDESHIRMLLDRDATYQGIIDGLISMRDNNDIQQGDTILIYYAGWGGEQPALIIPQDFDGGEIHGISDQSFGGLIKDIMLKRGDNVIVILDCCVSRSGIRNEDTAEGLFGPDLSSCVLFLAGGAGEHVRDGCFTPSFVNALESVSHHETTYVQLFNRLQNIVGQNPQLKGTNRHRFIFNLKSPVQVYNSYSLSLNNTGDYILHAGAADGVCFGAKFSVYTDHGTRLEGVMVPVDIEPFRTLMRPIFEPFPSFNQMALAVQTGAGLKEELKVFVPWLEPVNPALEVALMEMTELGYMMSLVGDRSDAHLAIENLHNMIGFSILDRRISAHDPTGGFYTAEANFKGLLHHAAHYLYHLNRSSSIHSNIETRIKVEYFKLDMDNGGRFGRPVDVNLLQDGTIISNDIRDIFRIRITNNTKVDLYPNVYYFDNSQLSIRQCYESGSPSQFKMDCPLPKDGGTLIFAFSPNNPDGQDTDVGFLKCFFSTSPIDISRIVRPLELMRNLETHALVGLMSGSEPHLPVESMHTSEPHKFKFLRPGSRTTLFQSKEPAAWDSVVIPVVKRGIGSGMRLKIPTKFGFQEDQSR